MTNRTERARIAEETVAILRAGRYAAPSGATVSIAEAVEASVRGTTLYRPEDSDALFAERDRRLSASGRFETTFEATDETTLAAARRLGGEGDVLALNFASAKNPGGGFLSGAQAQEESLARASGLSASLAAAPDFYEANRRCGTCLYTDHLVYSPRVPVFRDDADRLLDSTCPLSFVTAPAVNAGCVRDREPGNVGRIDEVMAGRIERVLSVAVARGHAAIVLGAWGCGVFKNDPDRIAGGFHAALTGPTFAGAFRRVVFAVLDPTPGETVLRPFARRFGRH